MARHFKRVSLCDVQTRNHVQLQNVIVDMDQCARVRDGQCTRCRLQCMNLWVCTLIVSLYFLPTYVYSSVHWRLKPGRHWILKAWRIILYTKLFLDCVVDNRCRGVAAEVFYEPCSYVAMYFCKGACDLSYWACGSEILITNMQDEVLMVLNNCSYNASQYN